MTSIFSKTTYVKTPHSSLFVKATDFIHNETVLLLHGGPGAPDYTENVAQLLRDQFNVIAFDQRGTGKSEALNKSYALEEYVEDIERIAAFFQLEQFHVLGHSWGAVLGQIYAKAVPGRLKSLFLSNAAPGTGKYWIAMTLEETRYFFRKASWKNLRQLGTALGLTQLNGKRADKAWQRFYGIVFQNYLLHPEYMPKTDPSWEQGIGARAITGTVQSILRTPASFLDTFILPPSVQVGILFGQYDFIQRTQLPTIKRYPRACVYQVKEAGHIPWIDNPEGFHQCLKDFYAYQNMFN
jgi:proline iminopeptidase